jgi:hypothetical protein
MPGVFICIDVVFLNCKVINVFRVGLRRIEQFKIQFFEHHVRPAPS